MNDIPASCRNRNCSFTFSEQSTPRVLQISPTSGGQSGDPITILGSDFSTDPSQVTVTIGNASCDITAINSTHIICTPSPQAAGSYPVRVRIAEVGYAIFNSSFQYSLGVNTVAGDKGGVGGGNILSISGAGFRETSPPFNFSDDFGRFYFRAISNRSTGQERRFGFSPNFHVLLDDNPCLIVRSNLTHIMCIAQPHGEGVVNLIVVMGNQRVTLPNAYEYTQNLTAVIHSSTPACGPVFGGTLITVRGNNFGNETASVTIGNASCTVISQTNEEINCTSTSSAPGNYSIFIHTRSRGQAVLATAANDTSISRHALSFNNRSCDQDDDSGSAPDLSPRSPPITCELPPLYPGFTYKLRVTKLTPCSGSLLGGTEVTIIGEGFGENSIVVKVTSVSGQNCRVTSVSSTTIKCLTAAVDGNVTAGSTQARRSSFRVHVQGFEATYYLNYTSNHDEDPESGSAVLFPSDEDKCPSCANLTSQLPHMSLPIFIYSPCNTPVVTGVYPGQVTLQSKIQITGERFGNDKSAVSITFGNMHSCIPTSVSMTTILCHLNQSSQPPPFIDLPARVHVNNLGFAAVNPANNSITIIPVITRFSPSTGSLLGGNKLTIEGGPFPANNLSVLISNAACSTPEVSYRSIQCTFPAKGEGNATIQLMFASGQQASCSDNARGCTYQYSESMTPTVTSITPLIIRGSNGLDTLTITGTLLNNMDTIITVGPYRCTNITIATNNSTNVTMETTNMTTIICNQFETIQPSSGRRKREAVFSDLPPAGSYMVSVLVPGLGISRLENGTGIITSTLEIQGVSPPSGSVAGSTVLTLTGYGFHSDREQNNVTIGGRVCVVMTSSYTSLICRTPTQSEGVYSINVTINGVQAQASYNYSLARTPMVSTIFPEAGQVGDEVTISGSMFSPNISDVSVVIGSSACSVSMSNETNLTCTLGANLAGDHQVSVIVSGKGRAQGQVTFRYLLRVESVSPSQGSFAGQSILTINGVGFNPTSISIRICDRSCLPTSIPPSLTTLTCTIPSFTDLYSNYSSHTCNVTVTSVGTTTVINPGYTFQRNLTSMVTGVNRTRGGTGGGSVIEITGTGFTAPVNVTIAAAVCTVISYNETTVVCETGPSTRTVRAPIMVFVEGKGFSISSVEFYYVDLWSSRFTWGGRAPPVAGDFVIVPAGQTLVLDVRTEVLRILLIQGGELIFDDEADGVELHSENILIVDGGKLQVGTEEEPYQHKAKIVMYGNVLSTEIPLFGAKTLAVRDGTLDLHGKKIEPTWTRLASTARVGDDTLHLVEPVSGWEVGGTIVIASTSFSQRENEELRITAISSNRSTLTISPPLRYTHIAVHQIIGRRNITTSAEVGYLTRNVVVRGNTDETWAQRVTNCPEEFRPGQFDVQTCFFGRFGAETIDDQFGSQIMLHRGPNDKIIGRIEYVEVTRAGQAFRLGRYPIHFHLNGDVNGSYVRGCGIHHTFNRAVTVHAVDHLLVEKNVAYNILGHAYFLEDGIEQGNIIQDNLGIFVRASSSLLNVDITPATFWVVNPNNTIRRNAAAGGTHFGFWYRLPQNPTGPSFTRSVFPRTLPLGEFSDNSAHSFGWYGLWIFPSYYPGGGATCTQRDPAVFKNFFAWRNNRGVEFSDVGAVQLKHSIMLDNKVAGVEYTDVIAAWGEKGAFVDNVLVVAHSALQDEDNITDYCTQAGIKTPHTNYLSVSGIEFYNFDRNGCFAIQACSHCRKPLQGGFETRFSNLTFRNSPMLTTWKWQSEHVHRDLDGTLTGIVGGALIPSSPVLPPSCSPHPNSSFGAVSGSVCDSGPQFIRFGMTNPVPSSLTFRNLNVTNRYGTAVLPYAFKRLVLGPGYMALLPAKEIYDLEWDDGDRFTNLSYSSLFSGLTNQTHLWVKHQTLQPVDVVTINSVMRNSSSTIPPANTSVNGEWFANTSINTVYYIVKGSDSCPRNVPIRFSTYRCFYPKCVPPPPPEPPTPVAPGRPNVTLLWSNTSTWPNGRVPLDYEDVFINTSMYVIVDVERLRLGRLTVLGGLELSDEMDHTLEADLILIMEQGRFVAGYPELPFQHRVDIILHGNLSTPEYRLPNGGPMLGAKGIGVFGELILTGLSRSPSWTVLDQTVDVGSTQLMLAESVDWKVGEEIVVASTSYEANQAEVFTILGVSNRRIITINGSFAHRHLAATINQGCCSVPIRAEVGLLSRSIRILSGDQTTTEKESFGCRTLVSTYKSDSGVQYTGTAQLQGVEFRGCGQEGFVERFDPRYSLAFLNTGTVTDRSYVRHCSFHDGYNVGIGVFGTNGMNVSDNVLHRTLGTSVFVTGQDHRLRHNLAVVALFPGTYKNRNEPWNFEWTANYELTDANNLMLTDNAAAGGARAGYHTNGENCISPSFQAQWKGNTAHSTLHGIHLAYSDGHTSGNTEGCSAFNDFTIFSCYHYGIFSYGQAGIIVSNAKLVNNYAAVFTIVIGPAALSHVKGNKEVRIVDSHIVSSFDIQDANCTEYDYKPEIANHPRSFTGLQTPWKGHAGIITASFNSAKGHFPMSPWWDINNYPSIGGLTTIRNVTFCRFGSMCGKKELVMMTHPSSQDCQHPVHLQDIKFNCVETASKFYNHMPIFKSINPSDCVDMDCDGLKKILIRDLDGSFSEESGLHTMVSMSELGWGMRDPDRGISDLRIPRTMLANLDGSRKDPEAVFPNKGIYRGTRCSWNADWNTYNCSGIDHLMMVLESLDSDTEVRRLSPVGLGAGGFIDLINGPQDHGWCGGYTCQERISTFYLIVATGLEYDLALTSTNPQNMRLQLLNANANQSILSAIYYTVPQRLDVYIDNTYVLPTNAYRTSDGNINYNASGDFLPMISNRGGVNYYNRTSKKLYIVIRGSNPITIRTTPVVQVSLTVSVTVDDFFERNLVSNLAFLLDIPESKIRVVMVISESSRGRRATEPTPTRVEIEIGDPPEAEVDSQPGTNTTGNGTSPYNQTMPTSMPTANTTSFNELLNITTRVGEAFQTGKLSEQLNITVTGAAIMEPQPPRTDPTGGVRAVNGTGGPQPGPATANLTTFSEKQREEDEKLEQEESRPIQLTIPSELRVTQQPDGAVEGRRLPRPLKITMYDNNGQPIANLGVGRPWELMASITSGPSGARLTGFNVAMAGGVANFTDLIFSHPGTYVLTFRITYPSDASFSITQSVTVAARQLRLVVIQQPPLTADTIFPLSPYASVHLVDALTGEVAADHGWRDRTWIVDAVAMEVGSGRVTGSRHSQGLSQGMAQFRNILIPNPGMYQLQFSIRTEPRSSPGELPASVNSRTITVSALARTKLIITFNNDYNAVRGVESEFTQEVSRTLSQLSNSVRAYNFTVRPGSIVVTFFVTSSSAHDLVSFVDTLTSSRGRELLSFSFRGTQLNATSIIQDPAYPISLPATTKYLVIIIACSAVAGTLLLLLIAMATLLLWCYCSKKKKIDTLKIKVQPMELTAYDNIYSNTPAGDDDFDADYPVFHLVPGKTDEGSIMVTKDSTSIKGAPFGRFSPSDGKDAEYVVSKEVKVGNAGSLFGSPFAETSLSNGGGESRELLLLSNNSNNNNNNNNRRFLPPISDPSSRISSASSVSRTSLNLPHSVPDPEFDITPLLAGLPLHSGHPTPFLPPLPNQYRPPLPNQYDALLRKNQHEAL